MMSRLGSLLHKALRLQVVLVVALTVAMPAEANPTLRIMPLGDSITYGSGSTATAGYRGPLWTALKDAGYAVDYVGTQTGNQPTGIDGFDPDHEGYPGWRVSHATKGLLEQMDDVFATVRDPHVILLLVGTNDTGDGQQHEQHLMEYYEALVDKLCTAQPDAYVVASSITWRGDDATRDEWNNTYFNNRIVDFVTAQQAKGRRVTYVDMRTALGSDLANFENNDLSTVTDKLHPNATGYAKMAKVWYDEIVRLFPDPSQVPAENAPAVVRANVFTSEDRPRIILDFNQPISDSSMREIANYTLDNGRYGPTIIETVLSNRRVQLAWNKYGGAGRKVELVVNGVQNEGGTKTIANQVLQLDIPGNSIVWEAPKDLSGDTDVVSEGELVFAYTQSKTATTVNGVTFRSAAGIGGFPAGYKNPHLKVNGFEDNHWVSVYCDPQNQLLPGMSEPYRQLINSGVWDGDGSKKKSLEIRDLVPGHEYLIQLWASDNRGRSDVHYWLILDDQVNLRYCINGQRSFGQYAIGRLKATETTATIHMRSETTSSACSVTYTAIQVRDITPNLIAWEPAKTIYDDSDVRTDGELVYAYNGNPTRSFVVNGTTFRRVMTKGIALRQKATFAATGPTNMEPVVSHDGFADGAALNPNATYPDSATGEYTGMLKNLLYAQGTPNDWTIALQGLTPGARYLVQVWYNDSRKNKGENNSAVSYQLIDGYREIDCQDFDNGRRGMHVTGTFTATGTTQSFSMCGRRRAQSDGNASLVAIQLRRLSDVFASEWSGYEYGMDASDVATVGTSVYACTPAASAVTVNGVTFASETSYSSWANGKITITGMTHRETTPYMSSYDGPELGTYKDLLAAGLWSSLADCPSLSSQVTISGLKECTPYLVQMWVNDGRSASSAGTRPGDDRTVTFGVWESIPYRGITTYNPTYVGPVGFAYVLTGPGQTSVSLTTKYGVTSTAKNAASPQINAVQVRELAQESATQPETWNASSDTWKTIDGYRKTAFVTGGTMALVNDVYVGGIASAEALQITGDDKKVYVEGGIDAPTCTVSAVWASRSASVCKDGLLALEGDVASLRLVVASRGTVVYDPTVGTACAVSLALANAGEIVVKKPLAVHAVVAGGGVVKIMGGGCLIADADVDLTGVTIAVDSGVGEGTTFLVTEGDLADEPTFALPGKAYVQKKTNAVGEVEWSYWKKGLYIFVR